MDIARCLPRFTLRTHMHARATRHAPPAHAHTTARTAAPHLLPRTLTPTCATAHATAPTPRLLHTAPHHTACAVLLPRCDRLPTPCLLPRLYTLYTSFTHTPHALRCWPLPTTHYTRIHAPRYCAHLLTSSLDADAGSTRTTYETRGCASPSPPADYTPRHAAYPPHLPTTPQFYLIRRSTPPPLPSHVGPYRMPFAVLYAHTCRRTFLPLPAILHMIATFTIP